MLRTGDFLFPVDVIKFTPEGGFKKLALLKPCTQNLRFKSLD
jgi:hypothetical protein